VTDLPDLETLLRELNTAANGVAAASTKLAQLTKVYENAVNGNGEIAMGVGTRYALALDRELVGVYEEAEAENKRPPAEDVRTALARQRLRAKDGPLVVEHDRVTTEMKALQRWISDNKQVISAKQSVVNGLRALGA
jgi:hypothetical protein